MSLLLLLGGGGPGGPPAQNIDLPRIDSGEVYAVTLAELRSFYLPRIPSGAVVWGPTLRDPDAPVPGSSSLFPRIGLAIFDAAYEGDPVALDEVFHRTWRDQPGETGSGTFHVQNSDPNIDELDYGRIARFSLDDEPAFAIRIEQLVIHAVSPGEERDEFTEVSGRGVLSVLDDGVVYPPVGVGRVPFTNNRLFNWASPDFDDTAWAAPVATDPRYGESDPATGAIFENFARPEGWPDDSAEWLWDRDSEPGGVPAGDVYFRHTFTPTGPGRHQLWAAADDALEVWLDGVQIGSQAGFYGGRGVQVEVDIDGGEHTIAVKATNNNALKAGLAVAVIDVPEDGTPGVVITHSDTSSWVCLPYPASVPGWTPGGALLALIDEAQARGALTGLTTTFTADVDSNGAPWDVTADLSFPIGVTLLAAVKQLGDAYITPIMAAGALALSAYRKNEHGRDTGVTFAAGVNVTSVDHEGRG